MNIKRILLAVVASLLLPASALAHQSIEVGGGAFRVIVGLTINPAYSGQMNAIDLLVRDAAGEPVANLEQSLTAVVVGPDGSEVTLTLRSGASEGAYTGNFIPTVSGDYQFRVSGFIGAVEFDEVFDSPAHSQPIVLDAAEISLP